MPKKHFTLELPFPVQGLNEYAAFEDQSQLTTSSCQNVRAIDPTTGRERGGQRPGTSKHLSFQPNGSNNIQDINHVVEGEGGTITSGLAIATTKAATSDSSASKIHDISSSGVSSATQAWATRLTDDVNGLLGVELDSFGNSYFTGFSGTASTEFEFTFWKVSPFGVVLLKYETKVSANASAIASDGSIYIAHRTSVGQTKNVTHIDANGTLLHEVTIQSGTTFTANDIVIDLDGNVIVAHGKNTSTAPGVTKFTPDLIEIWNAVPGDNPMLGIDVDSDGNVYVGGSDDATASIWKFDSNGNQLATFQTGAAVNKVKVGSDGFVYLAVEQDTSGDKQIWKLTKGLQEVASRYLGINEDAFDLGLDEESEFVYVVMDGGSAVDNVFKLNTSDLSENSSHRVSFDGSAAAFIRGIAVPAQGDSRESESTRSITKTVVSGGNLYSSKSNEVIQVVSGGSVLSSSAVQIFSTTHLQKVYFVDGTNAVVFDPATGFGGTASTWTATKGTLPAGVRLIEVWRSRIVMAGSSTDPQNWFMTAVDDALDLDFSPSTTTVTQAVAGNNAPAGKAGDVINAIIPFNDDQLIFGCDHSVWQMSGDPADGGRLDRLSDITGTAFGRPWVKSPDGNIYFFGSRGGVYVIQPNAMPTRVTSKSLDQRLSIIDLSRHKIRLVWDDKQIGFYVFITPINQLTPTINYYYDIRNDSWWPDVFNDPKHNPTAVHLFDGDLSSDRGILLGGHDGFVRMIDADSKNDDDVRIDSFVFISPVKLKNRNEKYVLKEVQPFLGDASDGVTAAFFTGPDAKTVLDSDPAYTIEWTAGRNGSNRERLSGYSMFVKVGNQFLNQSWQLEKLDATIRLMGRKWQRVFDEPFVARPTFPTWFQPTQQPVIVPTPVTPVPIMDIPATTTAPLGL